MAVAWSSSILHSLFADHVTTRSISTLAADWLVVYSNMFLSTSSSVMDVGLYILTEPMPPCCLHY